MLDRRGKFEGIGRRRSSVTATFQAHQNGGFPHLTFLANTLSFCPQYQYAYTAKDASVNATLDLCRLCNLVLFLINGSSITGPEAIANANAMMGMGSSQSIAANSVKTLAGLAHLDHLISHRGNRILTAIKAQGLPTPVAVIIHKEEAGRGGWSGSVVGNVIGGKENAAEVRDDGMMEEKLYDNDNDDDDDDGEGMDCATSTCMAIHRISKSIRRIYVCGRAKLKRYVSRFAVTEFGENSKVAEIEIVDSSGMTTVDERKESGMIDATANGTVATVTSSLSLSKKSLQTSLEVLIQMLCTLSASGPHWVDDAPRPYLVTD